MTEVLHGHDEICARLELPWPVVWRLARFAGLPVQDLDGPAPRLSVADLETWQRADFTSGRCGDETSAQA